MRSANEMNNGDSTIKRDDDDDLHGKDSDASVIVS